MELKVSFRGGYHLNKPTDRDFSPVEIKSGKRVHMRELRHLESCLEDYGKRAPWGLMLHDTNRVQRLGTKIVAVPIGTLI